MVHIKNNESVELLENSIIQKYIDTYYYVNIFKVCIIIFKKYHLKFHFFIAFIKIWICINIFDNEIEKKYLSIMIYIKNWIRW